ncbi:Txe/YoeB family addiction module toxin [Sphingomonas hankyongi]|uniref:Putative mRNA interferase YoeB n=1 Tax=Sphingomonas hankyongi TaxID=2908209 RepID=A0ABT0S589_9SPHN|nr:Txe/YoeB family addiction module toxin [Sphingomonas hankyongi]
MKLVWSPQSWEEYQYWIENDKDVLKRINELIKECKRAPFRGTGKPEPLKGPLQGWWSRRITGEDRLVYRVRGKDDEQQLEIAQCRYHY